MVCNPHIVPSLFYIKTIGTHNKQTAFHCPERGDPYKDLEFDRKEKGKHCTFVQGRTSGESTINFHAPFKMQDKNDTLPLWTRKEINVCARGEEKRRDGMIQLSGWIIWECPTQPRVSLSGRQASTLPEIQIPAWLRSAGAEGTAQGPENIAGALVTNQGLYRGEWDLTRESVVQP